MLSMLVLVAVKMSLTEAVAGDETGVEAVEGSAGGGGDALASGDNFLRALIEEPPVADRPVPDMRTHAALPAPSGVGSSSRPTAHALGGDNTHGNDENLFKAVEEYLRPDLEEYIENAAMKVTRLYPHTDAGPLLTLGAVTQRMPAPSARSIRLHLPQHLQHIAIPSAHHRLHRLHGTSYKDRRHHPHHKKHKFLLADVNIEHHRLVNEPLDEAIKNKQEEYLLKTEFEGIKSLVNLYLRPLEKQEQTHQQQKKGAHLQSPPPVKAEPTAMPRSTGPVRLVRIMQHSRLGSATTLPVTWSTTEKIPALPAESLPLPLSPSLLLPPLHPPLRTPPPPPRPLSVPEPIPVTVPVPIPQILWSTLPQTETTTSTIRHKGLGRFVEFIKKNRKILMRLIANKRIQIAQARTMGLQETSRTSNIPAAVTSAAVQRRARTNASAQYTHRDRAPLALGARAGANLRGDTTTPYYKGSHALNLKYNQNMMVRMDSTTTDAYDGRMAQKAQVNVLTTKHILSAKEIAQEKEAWALLARLHASAGDGGGGGGGAGGPVMRAREGARSPKPHNSIPVKVLDMAPAKGNIIETLRARRRLCQRHILNPEGPKYRRDGAPYIQAFRAVAGRDFAVTRAPRLLIPICCNCCVKSVLGCE